MPRSTNAGVLVGCSLWDSLCWAPSDLTMYRWLGRAKCIPMNIPKSAKVTKRLLFISIFFYSIILFYPAPIARDYPFAPFLSVTFFLLLYRNAISRFELFFGFLLRRHRSLEAIAFHSSLNGVGAVGDPVQRRLA